MLLTNLTLNVTEDIGMHQTNYVIEPKFDGVSIAIHYENDVFIQAVTRGNGETGEDVTNNVKTLRNLPLSLPLSRYGISRPSSGRDLYSKPLNQLNETA